MDKITPGTKRALVIISQRPGITAGDFAGLMWPGANMHRKVSNQGNGACSGKAAWLSGGSLAMKLVKRGLVRDKNAPGSYARTYFVTQDGRALLEADKVDVKKEMRAVEREWEGARHRRPEHMRL